MTLIELDHALRKLRLSGMAEVLEPRLRQAQTERLAPLDLVSLLVNDELVRRQDRLFARRHKQAGFRDADRSLDRFDFDFNKKMNRALIYELATGHFIERREDALFLGMPGTGKSHLAQAIGRAAIQQGYRVIYREAHTLLEEIAEASLIGTRKTCLADLGDGPLAHHRRSRDAETPAHGGRGPARTRDAPVRAGLHHPDVEPPRRRLGQTPGRQRGRDRAARPPAPSRPRAQMRAPELAHESADGSADHGRRTMTRRPRPWKLPAPRTAKNAAHRALENADAFSTSFHRRSSSPPRRIKNRRAAQETCVPRTV